MTFSDADLGNIAGYVTTRRDRGYSSLELRAKHLRFRFDDLEMQADVRERWENRGTDTAGKGEFLAAYLADRFVTKIQFKVSDETRGGENEPIVVSFSYHYPVDYRPGRWPIRWAESDLWPFSKVTAHAINYFDPFELGSEWFLSGGAHQYVETADLDVNEREVIWREGGWVPLPDSGVETIEATLTVVDTANDDAAVDTFVRRWEHSFEETPVPLTRERLRP